MSAVPKTAPNLPWTHDLASEPAEKVDGSCIGVGEGMTPEQVLHYATTFGFTHLIQKLGFEYDKELLLSEMLVRTPEALRQFPISTVFGANDLNSANERSVICLEEFFNSSAQKRETLDKVTKTLESKGVSQTINEDITLVADELFTNAVFNAPFVDPITQKNPGIDRHSVEVRYDGEKVARIFLAIDKSRLMIGCEDPFGSLNLERWLKKIKETYLRGPAATMNFGPGGAGLGSYIIFNAGASLYFSVWPGEATTLCCVVPLGLSNRKRVQMPKHLHWIQR